jgi:hypothetical protein
MRAFSSVLLILVCCTALACTDDSPEEAAPAQDAGVDMGADLGGEDVADEPDVTTPPDIPSIEEDVEEFVPACGLEDDLAPNQGPEEATEITSDYDRQGLVLCGGTSDWYEFDAVAGQELYVALDFDTEFADLDVYVYVKGERILEGATAEQVERIRDIVPFTDTLLLEVAGRLGGDVSYDLTVKLGCRADADCPEGRICRLRDRYCQAAPDLQCGVDEEYEPNESTGTATPIVFTEGAASLAGIHICADDEDYYRIELAAAQGLEVEIVHPRGAVVEVLLFSSDGVALAAAEGDNEKRLYAPFLGAGTFYLVFGQPPGDGAVPTTYRMTAAVLDGACTTDRDCEGLPQREFCNVDTGACEGIAGEGMLGFGESCDDTSDCVEDLEGCYTGGEGGGDNFCTVTCQGGLDCARFEDAYCLTLDFRGFGICAPGCEADSECPLQFRCDTEAARCISRGCSIDDDCELPGEDCIYFDEHGGLCLEHDRYQDHTCGVGTGPDAGENGSSSRAAVLELVDGAYEVSGLESCIPDEDWYVVELTQDAVDMLVTVDYERPGFIDIDIFAESGTRVGTILSDGVPARVSALFLPAGRYTIRISQFPVQDGPATISYDLAIATTSADCRLEEGSCNQSFPLRILCSEATGGCDPFDGDGAVELGGRCDSSDDCVEEAEFCWTNHGGGDGRNICTHRCGGEGECDDVADAECIIFGGRFGLCLPGEE